MALPPHPAGKEGTLILVSCCVVELARFEAITQCWNVVTVLCARNEPSSLLSELILQGNALVAALDTSASGVVLSLPGEVLREAAGIFLTGLEMDALRNAPMPDYHRDIACLTAAMPGNVELALLRKRLTSLRVMQLGDPDDVRFELRNFLSRSYSAASRSSRPPFLSWH